MEDRVETKHTDGARGSEDTWWIKGSEDSRLAEGRQHKTHTHTHTHVKSAVRMCKPWGWSIAPFRSLFDSVMLLLYYYTHTHTHTTCQQRPSPLKSTHITLHPVLIATTCNIHISPWGRRCTILSTFSSVCPPAPHNLIHLDKLSTFKSYRARGGEHRLWTEDQPFTIS